MTYLTNLANLSLGDNNFTIDVPPGEIYDRDEVQAFLATLKPAIN